MGARQVRQSNKFEYCPLCLRGFENRMAATSHYRKHARNGEIESLGTPVRKFRIINGAAIGLEDSPLYKAWWERGFHISHLQMSFQDDDSFLRQERTQYLVRQFKNENGW